MVLFVFQVVLFRLVDTWQCIWKCGTFSQNVLQKPFILVHRIDSDFVMFLLSVCLLLRMITKWNKILLAILFAFLGMVKWQLQRLSDLQPGDQKVNLLESPCYFHTNRLHLSLLTCVGGLWQFPQDACKNRNEGGNLCLKGGCQPKPLKIQPTKQSGRDF